MSKIEIQAIKYLHRHIDEIVLLLFSVIGFIVRVCGRNWISSDMAGYLRPWYDQIKQNGGLSGLGEQVGNYNSAYQTIIAILTYLPFGNVYGYKIVSCIFDYMIAFLVYIFIKKSSKKYQEWQAVLAYGLILLIPTSFFNSAYWGQCDSIYSFWCICTILSFICGRYKTALFLFGIAFGFKLQAIFVLPFILFIYIYEKRFSILHFIWIIVGYLFTAIPALISGKSLLSLIDIYADQTVANNNLYLSMPNVWVILSTDNVKGYWELKPMAIMLAIAILITIYYVVVKIGMTMKPITSISLAHITVYTCTMFLPAMHERYNYLLVMLSVIIAFLDKKTIPLLAVMSAVELSLYGLLFGNVLNLQALACFNILVYFSYIVILFLRENNNSLRENLAKSFES